MIEGIDILILLTASLLYVSLFKKDFTLLGFSGILLVLSGLATRSVGLYNLPIVFSSWFGIILVFLGGYVLIRCGLELLFTKKEDK